MIKKLGTAAIASCGLLMFLAVAPALADEHDEEAEIVETAQQAEEDTFGEEDAGVRVASSNGRFKATVQGDQVDIPEESGDPVTVTSGEGSLKLGLPGTNNRKGKLVDGRVAYSNVDEDLGLVVNTTTNGVRVSAVIETPEASHSLDYVFTLPNGGYLKLENDDSVSIRNKNGKVVNSVAPPWATDANGTRLQTWYTIEGNTLTQHIKPTANTVYPITADPEVHSSWWGRTYKLTRGEWENVDRALLTAAGASAATAIVCAAITAGSCTPFAGLVAAIITMGRGVLGICANSSGVDIHVAWDGTKWCSGY